MYNAWTDSEFWVGVGTLVGCVIVAIWVGGLMVLGATTESACLAAGWREAKVTWSWGRYCVTRNDQTDLVRPLADIRKEGRR